MTPDRYEKVQEIFLSVCDREPAEHDRLLGEACGSDAALRADVERLLAADGQSQVILPSVEIAAGSSAAGLAPGRAEDQPRRGVGARSHPERIGRYVIRSVLGEGGMGIVYRAEQDQPRREVALKVIRPGVSSRQLLRRLEHEAELLGRLQHPGIAQIFEAGTADTGREVQPFFAMELAPGQMITDYVRAKSLGTRPRLELVLKLCDAVQHAHQKGIIHRDLKPGNILVDESGQPKILDFGVARATDSDLQTTTLQTDVGQLIGTVPYMSPEQAAGDPAKLDTRSDVYSLGVVCYELLTEQLPHDLSGKTIPEAIRIVGQDDPTPLSAVNRVFRGDLDTLVEKALEKDKERRYQSASELGADIQRYLHDEPILARPPSATYQFRKLVARHRGLAAAVVALFALVSGFGVWMSVLYSRADDEARNARLAEAEQRRLAQAEAAARAEAETARGRERQQRELAEKREKETQQVSDFQAAMLRGIDVEAMGRGIKERLHEQVRAALERQYVGEFPNRRKRTPKEVEAELAAFDQRADAAQAADVARRVMDEFVLVRAADALEKRFADQPLVQAQLHSAIGTTYRDLGLYDAAEPHLSEAMEIRRRELGDDHPDTLTSISEMGYVLWQRGRWAEAESCYREALEGRRRVLGDEHPATLSSINDMGELLVDRRPDEAEPYYREALEGRRRVLGDKDPATLTSIHNIGYLLWVQGKPAEAEEYYREALEGERRVLGNTSLTTVHNMGLVLRDLGRPAEAERYFREVLEKSRPIWGDDNPDLLPTIHALASALHAQGKWEKAEAYFLEALEGCRRLLDDEHPGTLTTLNDMGVLLQAQRKPAEAEPYFREALEKSRRVRGEEHEGTLGVIHNLGFALEAQGKLEEAEACFREALEGSRRVQGNDHPDTLTYLNTMGIALQRQGKLDEAESLFADATRAARSGLGDHPMTAMIEHHYADVLRELGRLDEALDLARTAVDQYRANPDWSPREAACARRVLTATLRAAGRQAEALAVSWESVQAKRQRPGTTPGALASALAGYSAEAIAIGDTASLESAEGALRECLEIREAILPDDHPRVWLRYNAMSMLGEVLVEQATDASLAVETQIDKLREAEPLLLESAGWLTQNGHRVPEQVRAERLRQALERVVKLYEFWHAAEPDASHDAQAAEWRAELENLPGP